MPRLRHRRRTDPEDDTPDWAWVDDEHMPSERELDWQVARRRYDRGQRATDHPIDQDHPLPLSPQQHDVLICLSLGMHEPQIAEQLGLTFHAVKGSCREIRRKTNAKNEAEAFAICFRAGLIE